MITCTVTLWPSEKQSTKFQPMLKKEKLFAAACSRERELLILLIQCFATGKNSMQVSNSYRFCREHGLQNNNKRAN